MNCTLELVVQVAIEAPELPCEEKLQSWVEAALEGAGFEGEAEVVVRLVNEAESAALNEAYRHKQGPTNVLSFPFQIPEGVEEEIHLLGDVVICAPVVMAEAAVQHKALEAHWAHMVVHGVLHLLGYDHHEEDQAMAMEDLETRIITDLGFARPYGEVAESL
ncbi:MAG: rRNA maturation RNase YbeY [Candidatus Competibacteraceae bacterium]|nr:rRNA maturation RNase YbeY [Candidatus Competibacteraceae bacterium]